MLRHRTPLHSAEITDLIRDKSAPVKLQSGHSRLSVGRRAVDLLPVRIYMAPETSPPRVIQSIQRAVFLFQPLSESALAQIAVTGSVTEISRQLIGQMPEDHIFLFPESLRKRFVKSGDLRAHYRRCITEIMPFPRQVPPPVSAHLHHLRIFLCQPVGHGARRRRKDYLNPRFPQIINDLFQPFKVVYALFRFQYRP